eukprot:scaffold5651_cov108-Isochrysis_galbana.AAC.2
MPFRYEGRELGAGPPVQATGQMIDFVLVAMESSRQLPEDLRRLCWVAFSCDEVLPSRVPAGVLPLSLGCRRQQSRGHSEEPEPDCHWTDCQCRNSTRHF